MTRYARALGSKGSNARVPEPATPWSEMGVVNVDSPDGIEEKMDNIPKEKSAVKLKKKVVKLGSPAANQQKPKASEKIMKSEPFAEETRNKCDKADTIGEANKTLDIVTNTSTKSGKKRKALAGENDSEMTAKVVKNKEGIEEIKACSDYSEKIDNTPESTPEKPNKKKEKKNKNSMACIGDERPADFVALNSEKFHPTNNEHFLEEKEKNGWNEKKGNTFQENKFQNFREKKFSKNQEFRKQQGKHFVSEKDQINKLATQKMNEEKYVKIRQDLVNSGMKPYDVELRMHRIRQSLWKRLYETICRRCRKRGHILKDCPQSASNSNTKCYKCGETDHTSRMCLIKEEVYTYADCFICHQTGHLTRSCPKNSRGIYPRGGCCHYCSEVTHLARDCPNKNGKMETENRDEDDVQIKVKPVAVTLDVYQSADADVTERHPAPKPLSKAKGKRVVKF